jgi:hypothetical protein
LNIINRVDNVLVPALLENLMTAEHYDDSEDGELNVISSTKSCLTSISEAIKDKYLSEYAFKFVGSKPPIGRS